MRLGRALSILLLVIGSAGTTVLAQAPSGAEGGAPTVAPRKPSPKPSLPAGTSEVFVQTMNAWDFSAVVGTFDVASIGGVVQLRDASTPAGGFLAAGLHLATGVLIHHIELDYCDVDASSDMYLTFLQCVDDASGPGPCSVIDSIYPTGTPGCSYVTGLSPLNFTVQDQANKDYIFYVYLPGSPNVGFRGVKIYYFLQVSPAPMASDFLDVPTSSPLFPFVEALYQSGITAGCGGGNYCPNNPVTRGQLAVFLAKALGLNWAP